MTFYHGSPHQLDIGDILTSGISPANYDASADIVYFVDNPLDAYQWGEDAHIMIEQPHNNVYVYEVIPHGKVTRFEHPDGFVEYQASAATILSCEQFTTPFV